MMKTERSTSPRAMVARWLCDVPKDLNKAAAGSKGDFLFGPVPHCNGLTPQPMTPKCLDRQDVAGCYGNRRDSSSGGEEPDELVYSCPCGKKFKRRATYRRHMDVAHSSAESHKCQVCGKTFGNVNTLTMHMSVHRDSQVFSKTVECCSLRAASRKTSASAGAPASTAPSAQNQNGDSSVASSLSSSSSLSLKSPSRTGRTKPVGPRGGAADAGVKVGGLLPRVSERSAADCGSCGGSAATVPEAAGGGGRGSSAHSEDEAGGTDKENHSPGPLSAMEDGAQEGGGAPRLTRPSAGGGEAQPVPPHTAAVWSHAVSGHVTPAVKAEAPLLQSLAGGAPSLEAAGPLRGAPGDISRHPVIVIKSEPVDVGDGGDELGFHEDPAAAAVRKSQRLQGKVPGWKHFLQDDERAAEEQRSKRRRTAKVKVENEDEAAVEELMMQQLIKTEGGGVTLESSGQWYEAAAGVIQQGAAVGRATPNHHQHHYHHLQEADGDAVVVLPPAAGGGGAGADGRPLSSGYVCAVCKKEFVSEKYLTMHMSLHKVDNTMESLMSQSKKLEGGAEEGGPVDVKGGLSPPANGGGVNGAFWTCKICHKTFAQNSNYKNHIRTHSDERPFVCEICSIGFKERYHLKKHMLFKHSNELKEECRVCGKKFKDSTAVRAHERIHSDVRPYSCRRCGKSFKTSECLWHHENRSKTCGQALLGVPSPAPRFKRGRQPKRESNAAAAGGGRGGAQHVTIMPAQSRAPGTAVVGVTTASSCAPMMSAPPALVVAPQPGSAPAISLLPGASLLLPRQDLSAVPQQGHHLLGPLPPSAAQLAANSTHGAAMMAASVVPTTAHSHGGHVTMTFAREDPVVCPTAIANHELVSCCYSSAGASNSSSSAGSSSLSPPGGAVTPPTLAAIPTTASVKVVPNASLHNYTPIIVKVEPETALSDYELTAMTSDGSYDDGCAGNLMDDYPSTPSVVSALDTEASLGDLSSDDSLVNLSMDSRDLADTIRVSLPMELGSDLAALDEALVASGQILLDGVSSKRQVRYACDRCGKQFVNSAAFDKHMLTHSEARPYKCDICDVGFKLKVHLKKHNLYRHSDEYPCQCKVCGKKFKDSSAVRLHERIHSEDRPFRCECGKSFKTRENLWGHRHRGPCERNKGPMTPGVCGSGLPLTPSSTPPSSMAGSPPPAIPATLAQVLPTRPTNLLLPQHPAHAHAHVHAHAQAFSVATSDQQYISASMVSNSHLTQAPATVGNSGVLSACAAIQGPPGRMATSVSSSHTAVQATIATPHSVAATSRSMVATPYAMVATPHATVATPFTMVATPHTTVATPYTMVATPHSMVSTSHSMVTTPHSMVATPHSMVATPHTMVATPHTMVATPHSMVATPHTMVATPISIFTTPHTRIAASQPQGQATPHQSQQLTSLPPSATTVTMARGVQLAGSGGFAKATETTRMAMTSQGAGLPTAVVAPFKRESQQQVVAGGMVPTHTLTFPAALKPLKIATPAPTPAPIPVSVLAAAPEAGVQYAGVKAVAAMQGSSPAPNGGATVAGRCAEQTLPPFETFSPMLRGIPSQLSPSPMAPGGGGGGGGAGEDPAGLPAGQAGGASLAAKCPTIHKYLQMGRQPVRLPGIQQLFKSHSLLGVGMGVARQLGQQAAPRPDYGNIPLGPHPLQAAGGDGGDGGDGGGGNPAGVSACGGVPATRPASMLQAVSHPGPAQLAVSPSHPRLSVRALSPFPGGGGVGHVINSLPLLFSSDPNLASTSSDSLSLQSPQDGFQNPSTPVPTSTPTPTPTPGAGMPIIYWDDEADRKVTVSSTGSNLHWSTESEPLFNDLSNSAGFNQL